MLWVLGLYLNQHLTNPEAPSPLVHGASRKLRHRGSRDLSDGIYRVGAESKIQAASSCPVVWLLEHNETRLLPFGGGDGHEINAGFILAVTEKMLTFTLPSARWGRGGGGSA